MLQRVEQYIRENSLLSKNELSLVALSGGADSVALLLVLLRLGYPVEAVHCNFRLRGTESDRDEHFAKELCSKLSVKLHLIHFETKTYAEIHQVSIEMAARQLRYRYFLQLAKDIEAKCVCVAHHQDDAVETLLINLLRGTGIHGLTGIRPRNGQVVRPLLCVSRKEILEYLHDCGQDFMTDSTNLVPDVLRNKIRLQLLPLMENISPAARKNLLATARNIAEAEKVYVSQMEEWQQQLLHPSCDPLVASERLRVSVSRLLQLPSPSCFLHEWLSPMGFTPAQTMQMTQCLNSQSGKVFSSATHEVLIDRNTILVQPKESGMKSLNLPESGNYRYKDDMVFCVDLREGAHISKDNNCASLDAGTIHFPLTIRPVQVGDRFQPYGMEGSRLVSDYLTDLKLSLFDKRRQLVVTDATGLIIWIVGHRTAHPCRVTPDTSNTLLLKMIIE